jgi:hypothetical protein
VIKQWNDPITPEVGVDTPQLARDEQFEKQRNKRERRLPVSSL